MIPGQDLVLNSFDSFDPEREPGVHSIHRSRMISLSFWSYVAQLSMADPLHNINRAFGNKSI